MILLRSFAVSLAFLFAFVSCGEPERAHPTAIRPQPFRGAGEFDQVGTVSMSSGESCASKIMFVFHGGRSASTSLSAPWRQSTILKEAAHAHHRVRIIGKWRRGKTPDCTYVEATQVEIQKSFW